MSLAFLVTALVVVIAPGTGVLYTLACALARGWRAGIAAAAGCTLGIVPHLAASILGLAALLHTSATAFQALKIAGALYLLYLAWITLRDRSALAMDTQASPRSGLRIALTAVGVNLLNPKLSLFFLAFLPQFVPADAADPTAVLLGLSGVFMAMTFIVFALYGCAAALVRDAVLARPRILAALRFAFAGTFAGLGLKLALSDR